MRIETKRFIQASGMAQIAPRLIRMAIENSESPLPDRVKRLVSDAMIADIGRYLEESLAPAIEATYTENDIRELTAFYETPIGRKAVDGWPRIQEIALAAGHKWVAGVIERILPEAEQIMDEEQGP